MISGTAGYLMFGNNVSDAIMKDLLLPQYGFSIPLNQVATWMIVSRENGCVLACRQKANSGPTLQVINPIAKFALCCRPVSRPVRLAVDLTIR